MRKTVTFFLLLAGSVYGRAQSIGISPAITTEICPHPNFNNAVEADPYVQRFVLDFGGYSADYFSINTGADKPVACRIIGGLRKLSTDDSKAEIFVAFQDQRDVTPSFRVQFTTTGSGTTFKFTRIRSLKGLAPVVGFPSPLNLPLCTTGNIPYTFTKMVRYQTTDTDVEFGSNIPLYEYSVPKGWKVANITSTGPDNYILAVPGAAITYDEFHSGDIKIRATQTQYICYGNSAGAWDTIPVTRPVMKLTANGSTALTLTCGTSSTYTFTVENGHLATCATYVWNLGSANNNWGYNGSPAPQAITTTTNSIALTSATCNGAPSSVSVTVRANNADIATYTVPVTLQIPQYSISGPNEVCTSANYTIDGLPCNAAVQWTSSNPSIATVTGNGGQATVMKTGDGEVTISAAISGLCNTAPVLTKPLQIGVPTSWYDLITQTECFLRGQSIPVYAQLSQGQWSSTFEWGYRSGFDPSAPDVVLPSYTTNEANFRFSKTGVYGIYCRPKNACGAGIKSTRGIPVVISCDEEDPMLLRTSPNPATSELIVTIDEKSNYFKEEQSSIINLYLYRFSDGQLAKQWSQTDNQSQYRLRLQDIQKGTYVLTVSKGKKKLTKLVIIE